MNLPPHPDAASPAQVDVVSLLQSPVEKDLEGGLPRMGVSASDHVAVGAEFAW